MLSVIDEIKERLDIVQVISEYLQLKKVGSNYRTLCPFHSEKNPSFYVSPSRQIFKCFGCLVSGDVFKFIMQIEGLEFKEALKFLAKKAGIELKPEPKEKRTEKERIFEICELSARFFEIQLKKSKAGKKIQEYLFQRGISKESIKKWRLGYAPNAWRGLSDFLVARGYKREEIVNAGLAIKPEDEGLPYDRFRSRIIFPIFDIHRNVIGFGGRIEEKEELKNEKEPFAKYINTPNTLIYDKSKILYGLNNAKMEIRKNDSAILVEGYTDVILSHQAGIENTVSTSGTALTPYQLKILSRYTKNLILAFDMDIAGEEATKRGIDLAQLFGFNIKIASLPEDKDPADIIKEDPKIWKEIILNAKDIIEFYFEKAFSKFDKNTLEGKKEITKTLLPFISRLQNRIEQSWWVQRLSEKLKIEENFIWQEINKFLKLQDYQNYEKIKIEEEIPAASKPLRRKIEERILILLLYFLQESKISEFKKEIKKLPPFSFKEGKGLIEFFLSEKPIKKAPKEIQNLISELEFQIEIEKLNEGFKENAKKEIDFCIKRLKKIHQEEKLKKAMEELKKTEFLKDKEKIENLIKELKLKKSKYEKKKKEIL